MIWAFIIAVVFIVIGKALVFSYLAGRTCGYQQGWEDRREDRRILERDSFLPFIREEIPAQKGSTGNGGMHEH